MSPSSDLRRCDRCLGARFGIGDPRRRSVRERTGQARHRHQQTVRRRQSRHQVAARTVADVIRHAYGDATATIFQIGAACAVVAIIAILFIPNRPLRKTIDIETPAVEASGTEADAPSRTAG